MRSAEEGRGDRGERTRALRLALHAMGTRFELVLAAEGPSRAEEARLRAAGEAALAEVLEADRRLSLFRPGSLLAHVNRRAHTGWVEVDLDTFELLADAAGVHQDSGGAFDPTIAPLMVALGFHAEQVGPAHAPGHGDLRAERRGHGAAIGMEAVELDPRRRAVRFAMPGIRLDLGAIAKGHALDLAARALREGGVSRALLHGGTSAVVALGAPPGAGAWGVGLGAPAEGFGAMLTDAALCVSAPHGRVVERAGELLGHVLDPRSGRPAGGVLLAAVLGPWARRADAWSTALVAGAPAPAGPTAEGLAWIARGQDGGGARSWREGGAAPGARFEGPR